MPILTNPLAARLAKSFCPKELEHNTAELALLNFAIGV